MTVALASGGVEHFGWGVDRHLAADTFDALNQNTRATGNWGKKGPPKFPEWPRPIGTGKNKPEAKQRRSVKDIYQQFSRR